MKAGEKRLHPSSLILHPYNIKEVNLLVMVTKAVAVIADGATRAALRYV